MNHKPAKKVHEFLLLMTIHVCTQNYLFFCSEIGDYETLDVFIQGKKGFTVIIGIHRDGERGHVGYTAISGSARH